MSTIQHELNQAVASYQLGLLGEAARTCQAILSREPAHVQALHVLGLIHLRQGQPERAVDVLGQAAALRPQVADLHAHLGEAYRILGRLERAETCFRSAVHLKPDSAEFHDILGLILLGQGKAEAAVELFRQALRLQPDRAGTHNVLGAALKECARGPKALDHFRQAVQLDPCLAEAHGNLGQMLLEMDDPQQALFHCREAVRLQPDLAGIQLNLGNVLNKLGQYREARAAYAEAMRLAPDLALGYHNMGRALEAEGRVAEAVAWYRQALARQPASPPFRTHLAEALTLLEQYDEAVQHFRAVLAQDPRWAEAYNGLGLVCVALGQYEAAARYFRAAIELKPDWATAHSNLGNVLQQLGEFEPALASLRATLRIDSRYASALGQLANLLRDRMPEEELASFRQLLNDPGLRDLDRSALHFGLAHVLDARGDHAGAARQLDRANAFQKAGRGSPGYDPAEHTRFVDGLIEAFSATYFTRVQDFGLEAECPVFIVGLPRSGTTLVEQILASHSQVHGTGEPNRVPRSFDSLPQFLNRDATPLACLRNLERSAVQELGRRHLAWLRERDATAARVIDKLPDNYLYLGWIVTLFPRARIVHCRRDLRDVALSCWMTNFSSVDWASDPAHIVSRFADNQRLMAHWRKVLPAPIQEVVYEDLVADLEGVARRLVSFCGLEWERGCLQFHRTRRPVTSASLMQVRQPIYATSVGRWKRYESLLTPLFSRVNDLVSHNQPVRQTPWKGLSPWGDPGSSPSSSVNPPRPGPEKP